MTKAIDWAALSKSLNLLEEDGPSGWQESSNSEVAREAIAKVMGRESIRSAVDFYISHMPGSELARSVLWLLRPWPAMERCYEIFESSEEPSNRQSAVELLRVVADRRVLNWIPEFLSDSDEAIQAWGIGVIDQLAWSNLINAEEALSFVELYQDHRNPEVRKTIVFIKQYLAKRDTTK